MRIQPIETRDMFTYLAGGSTRRGAARLTAEVTEAFQEV
jgi:hypothetical protein